MLSPVTCSVALEIFLLRQRLRRGSRQGYARHIWLSVVQAILSSQTKYGECYASRLP